MGFSAAAFLWGIPLVGLPIIVHLMARRRKTVIDWGAMQFLVAAKQRVRRSWRLRDLILLLLRVLALLALIFALAQPLIPMGWLGGHEPRDVIVIIDESMSTGALDGASTIHERQWRELEGIFSQRDVDATDQLRVLVAGAEPVWLTEIAVPGDGPNRQRILESLSRRSPSLATADLPAGIEMALAVKPTRPGMPRHIHVITDAQAYGWNADMTVRWEAVRDRLNEFPSGSEIRVWPVGGADAVLSNLVVQKVELSREVVGAMEPVTARATVTNFSENESGTAILHWLVDGEEAGVVTVPSIDPGSDSTVSFEHHFPETGLFEISCLLESGDALELDDRATAIIEVASGIPVLLVEGKPSDDPLETDSAYLMAALGGFQEDDRKVASAFRPALVTAEELGGTELSSFKAIVLTNIPPLSDGVVAKLQDFVRGGGGLWLALGDQMRPDWFNEKLVARGSGLVPLAIDEAQGDAAEREKFEFVSPPTQPHPATVLLADTDRLDIDRAKIYRRFPFAEAAPRDVQILLQFGDGSPLALERQFGKGRVIMQSVPLGASWSNMPLLLSYVAMVHEWLWYLVEPVMVSRNLSPGEPIELALDRIETSGVLVIETPGGDDETIGPIAAGVPSEVRYVSTLDPGLYHLGIRPGGSDEVLPISAFSVDRDPEESNLARLEAAHRSKLRDAGLAFGAEVLPAKEAERAPVVQKPVWEWLLIGVILFLIGESVLALWISMSRRPVTAGARMNT